jgi:tRNA pseudouridine38-40 synthase
MARYQIILAYDGTNFCGFQKQSDERTVQGDLENALHSIGWLGKSIIAAGRTDTGVHAQGQVVAFDLDWVHGNDSLRSALNANLPPDVAVKSVQLARDDFHPRFDAVERYYRYCLYCQPVRDPLRDRYAWQVWPPVDLMRLKKVSHYLLGEHDFAAFGTPMKKGGSTWRKVFFADWTAVEDEYYFEIGSNAFLYHMVRRLVSYQVEIGQGRNDPSSILDVFTRGLDEMVQGLAPPNGLFLTCVKY